MDEYFTEILNSRNIKMSYQRIKILEYLASHPCHPYADIDNIHSDELEGFKIKESCCNDI